jgi:hypothetical protein
MAILVESAQKPRLELLFLVLKGKGLPYSGMTAQKQMFLCTFSLTLTATWRIVGS